METLIPRTRTLLLCALLLSACAGGKQKGSFADLNFKRRPSLPVILTLMPNSASARETYNGLVEELGEEFDLVPELVDSGASPEMIARAVREHSPKAVVLMNNPTLRLFRKFQAIATPAEKKLPAIAVLTSFLQETSQGLSSLTGVIYEVPLVTALVNLRALVRKPIRKVGVLYRPIFSRFIKEQRALGAKEGIELIGLEISGSDPAQLQEGLQKLRLQMDVDAIWVPNDNVLLSRKNLLRGWLPALRENQTPVIVNVRSLLSRRVSFGTFAVLPAHRALGIQTAQLITSVADRGWVVEAPGEFEYPISVEKVLDMNFARRYLELKEKQLATVDQLVE